MEDNLYYMIGRIITHLADIELTLDQVLYEQFEVSENESLMTIFLRMVNQISFRRKVKIYSHLFPEEKEMSKELEKAGEIRNKYAHSVIFEEREEEYSINNLRKLYADDFYKNQKGKFYMIKKLELEKDLKFISEFNNNFVEKHIPKES